MANPRIECRLGTQLLDNLPAGTVPEAEPGSFSEPRPA